jgi:hypothetical protein
MSIGIPKSSSLPEFSEQPSEVEPKKEEEIEQKLPSIDDIIVNHEQRLQSIESALLRIRGAI